jgi:hypothetical protein
MKIQNISQVTNKPIVKAIAYEFPRRLMKLFAICFLKLVVHNKQAQPKIKKY